MQSSTTSLAGAADSRFSSLQNRAFDEDKESKTGNLLF